jgi:hypothetical protein
LAKRRIREFKDARRAMEKEANDRDPGPGTAKRSNNGKKEKEKGLLKAAILNNAVRGMKRGSASGV